MKSIKILLCVLSAFTILNPFAFAGYLKGEESFFCTINGEDVDLRKGIFISQADDGSQATAFFAQIKNKNFIVSNPKLRGGSFVSSLYGVDGSVVNFSAKGFVSPRKNIIINPAEKIPEGTFVFPMSNKLNEFVKIGDPVKIVGNHKSDGFIRAISGEVSALGPSSIELSCGGSFDSGSVGSPVVHIPSGTCIGVISCVFESKSRKGQVVREQVSVLDSVKAKQRFFVVRFDVQANWVPVKSGELEKINCMIGEASEATIIVDKFYKDVLSQTNTMSEFRYDSIVEIINTKYAIKDLLKILDSFNADLFPFTGNSEARTSNVLYVALKRRYAAELVRFLQSEKGRLRNSSALKIFPDEVTPICNRMDILMDKLRVVSKK